MAGQQIAVPSLAALLQLYLEQKQVALNQLPAVYARLAAWAFEALPIDALAIFITNRSQRRFSPALSYLHAPQVYQALWAERLAEQSDEVRQAQLASLSRDEAEAQAFGVPEYLRLPVFF
ncbi:MAG: hypothetical protein HC915_15885 [Anaerolineae bacterium]|nr:hypothetical protein [Anaerolineae bacterium]